MIQKIKKEHFLMFKTYEVIFISPKTDKETCWGDFEENETGAILYQQFLEYEKGYICWINRI